MKTVEKKVLPEYFEAIFAEKKNFELRLNYFDVEEGDTLLLREWDGVTKDYTGRQLEKKVSYVAKFKIDQLFWPVEEIMDKGIQIISLKD